ncbi:hypothetical protein Ciccas_000199 [Cichlidogyrus casuarinus]|uniref:Uncharacterized protein n=1 Tax=Cichlidogyrus casuarinus TaxID=1844966 RepID=A0ABD2QNQ0_9PLAT
MEQANQLDEQEEKVQELTKELRSVKNSFLVAERTLVQQAGDISDLTSHKQQLQSKCEELTLLLAQQQTSNSSSAELGQVNRMEMTKLQNRIRDLEMSLEHESATKTRLHQAQDRMREQIESLQNQRDEFAGEYFYRFIILVSI